MKKHMFWLFHLLSTVQWVNAQEFRDSIQGTYRYWDDVKQEIIGSEYLKKFLIKYGLKDTMEFLSPYCGDSLLYESRDKSYMVIKTVNGKKEGNGNLPSNCDPIQRPYKTNNFYFNSEYPGSVLICYSVWIGPSPGWGNEVCIIRVSESVGREDELEQIKLSLSPNPVQTHLKLSLSNAVHAHIGIFDLHGRQLLEKQTQVAENELDVSELPAGMYWLRVQSPAGMVCKSFVKE